MSGRRFSQPRRVCVVPLPKIDLGPRKREIGVYLGGAFFAAGWWLFIDACVISSRAKPDPSAPFDPVPVHVRFPDWLPGLFSTLGMIIVNLIDKQRLLEDGGGMSWGAGGGGSVAWIARLFLFLGFALMAGGLAGSVVVLVLKYVIPQYAQSYVINWGVANVVQNALIMLSAIVLWLAQSADDSYEYNLTL